MMVLFKVGKEEKAFLNGISDSCKFMPLMDLSY